MIQKQIYTKKPNQVERIVISILIQLTQFKNHQTFLPILLPSLLTQPVRLQFQQPTPQYHRIWVPHPQLSLNCWAPCHRTLSCHQLLQWYPYHLWSISSSPRSMDSVIGMDYSWGRAQGKGEFFAIGLGDVQSHILLGKLDKYKYRWDNVINIFNLFYFGIYFHYCLYWEMPPLRILLKNMKLIWV